MKMKSLAFLSACLIGLTCAAESKVIIIAPNDLVTAWQGYAKDRTSATYEVVNARDIYAAYPYTTGEAGKPRNPAESIHAFIRAKAAEGVGYFMLGGAWFDAQNLEKQVYFQGTDLALNLDNAIPGVYQYAYNNSASPSDLFYACHDVAEGSHPWDADGDGKYLNDVTYTDGVANYDLTPAVVVSRVSLKSATGMDLWGIRINNGSTDLAAMVSAFSAKVAAGESADFAGRDQYALVAGAVNDNLYQRERKEILPLFEREYEYYDGLPNFGDPAHETTGNATTELLVRRRLRDQIAAVRPVVETDILSSGGWARRYATFQEAVAGYRANSHEFDMMYSHGLISGGEVWGLSVGSQFLHPGDFGTMTGLNLFADYAGPCFGGVPDNTFTRNGRTYADFSCVEAMIANPTGGAVAAVGNARSGIYEGNYTVDFDNDFSWKLANRLLVNFIQRNTTAGEAWKNTITSYVNDKSIVNGTHILIIAQEMLYGDPLVKLPSTTPDPALTGIETAESALTIGEGRGHGGSGVTFTGAKGTLTLTGDEPYYLGGLQNATLAINGDNKTIDLDACDLDGSFSAVSFKSGITATTLRSTTRGALSKINNSLTLPMNTSVELDTWDAFGDTKGTIYVSGMGAELVIGPNLCYPERDGHGESLNADISFVGAKDLSLTVHVAKGGLFTPLTALTPSKTTRTMTKSYTYTTEYVIDSYDGLGGTVTVPSGAKLVLKDIPLVGLETLTVESGATLVIPAESSLDELVSAGLATVKAGALVGVGDAAPVALTEDQTIDGSTYVQKYYYGTAENWESGVKVSRKNGGECDITPAEKDIVVFAQGERFPSDDVKNLYIKQTTAKTIEVVKGTRLFVGAGYGGANGMNGRSFIDGWNVTVEGGSSVSLAGWGYTSDAPGGTRDRTYGMDGTVTFNGAGDVRFSNWDAKAYIVENVKGSATLVLEKGVSVKPLGTIENPISGEGTLIVTDVTKTYTLAPGWEGAVVLQGVTGYVPKVETMEDGCSRLSFAQTHTFKVGLEGDEAGKFWLDGKEFLIRCGEMHYGRIPKGYWRDRIRKTKAAGFNAVCAYMFWNNHEPVPGHFRFDGEQDVREFCKIAQEEGMWVVLRPGPYTCAEWEFGGYPWWLLSSKMSEDGQINIRTKDADYRYYTDRYMQKVGEQLADMQITRGGNIIMIQVENEYGTYGNDAEYMKMEYDAIVNAGFTEIPKFTCNPTFNNGVTNARIPELFYVVNGSGGFFDGENRIQKLIDARLPGWENAPLMIGEYYTAWYDSWGGTHQTKAASAIVNDFRTFIERGVSFSVYMVYGGTSFGWWGGFNTPFVPMTTSYDYDSPINETGKLTDKFYAIKELFDQNLNEGETAVADEDVPSWVGVQSGTIAATPTVASLWNATTYTKVIDEPTDAPLTFENADLGYGYAIYETTLAAGQGGKLMADCRDLGVVRVDGEFVGYLDRRTTWGWVEIAPADHPRKLEILVEALGRNHYAAFNDASKGLRGKPTLDKVPLSGWTMKTFDFLKWDDAKGAYASEMNNLVFTADANPSARSGAFYKYNVTLDPTKDALLDMRDWRRGMVCVNGTWVGRYWTIGPQQTLYIPGCWLKAGENANEIIILDTVGVEPAQELKFAESHIISENRSDLDYYTPPDLPELPKSLEALWGDAVKTGNLANNRSLQTVNFDMPATGRYVAFKATSAHSGQYAACAEFNLLDAAGQAIDRTNWTIVSCSSQEQRGEDAQIEKLIDGDNSTIWHSEWKVVQSTLPQYFVIDLGEEKTIGGFTWLGRQSGDAGFVNAYSVYVMDANPAIDPVEGVVISTGTVEDPFVIDPASSLNNVKVTVKSGAVLKVLSSANCTLTISGEGSESILMLDGSVDYGLNAGSKLANLTVLIDAENAARKIWLETRNPAVYDESVNLVIKNGIAVISGGGDGVTFGSVTIDGGTLDIRNSTPITVTDTLWLREGESTPAGVTLAEGAQIKYIVELVDLVWDNSKTDWNDSTQAYRGEELVAIGADDTVVFKNFTSVLYDKRTNKTPLHLEVREGDLKIGHDGYLNNGNGPKNLPDGSVVTIAGGSKVILQAWDRSTQSEKTVDLDGTVTFNGPGSVELADWIQTSMIGSINGTATLNLGTGTVTLRDGAEITSPMAASTATLAGSGTVPYFSGMQFANTWTGTVKAGAVNNGGASLNVNRYGIEGSTVAFDSLTNFWFPNDGRTVNPTLMLKGEMLVDDMSAQHYVLKHVTSTATGSLVIGKKKNIDPASFTITKMSDFAGTLKNTTAKTVTIDNLVIDSIPTSAICAVRLVETANEKVAVTRVTLPDGTDVTDRIKIVIKDDGIYIMKKPPFVISIS